MRRRFPPPNGFPNNPRRQAFEARLAQAHSLFAAGQFLQSAQLFEELGAIAEARSGPRAPRFYMQAGRGYLHAGKLEEGMALLEKGRQQFIKTGRSAVAARISYGLIDEFKTLGLTEQSQIMATWAEGVTFPTAPSASRPPLPLKCPSCGASIHPNDVNWLDAVTAECDFCGSPLRGT
jgi:hypothetical protein